MLNNKIKNNLPGILVIQILLVLIGIICLFTEMPKLINILILGNLLVFSVTLQTLTLLKKSQ